MTTTPTKAQVESLKQIAITQYATCFLAVILWLAVVLRIICNKAELRDLTIICVLMILYQFLSVAVGTHNWIECKRSYLGKGNYEYGQLDEDSSALISVS